MTPRWRLTRAGFGAILIAALMLVAGLLKTINPLVLLGDLLLVLVILNAIFAWRATRKLRIEREQVSDHSDHFAGQTSARSLSIVSERSGTTTAEVRERSPGGDWSAFAESIPSHGRVRLRGVFTPMTRGVFSVTTTIASGYPFGFVSVERRAAADGELIVFPPLGRIDRDRLRRWLIRGGSGDARTRRFQSRPAAQRSELRGVRPFRSGDSPRLIHWRTTARRNELMVREYDSPDAHDLVLALEAWLPERPSPKERRRFEAAISLAATLLDAWCHSEQSPRVTLAVVGRKVAIEGRAGSGLARRFYRALAAEAGHSHCRFDPLGVPPGSSRAIRLLVSSRIGVTKPVPGWQRVTPRNAPAWYHRPRPPE